ncbi:MAG: hypothetical protein R3B93_03460 [Bacteroidia bacterium]
METEGGFIPMQNLWWRTSGRAVFDPQRFYLPISQHDPFGHTFTMNYDSYSLSLVETSTQVYGKTVRSQGQLDYHSLQPKQLIDPNNNRSEVIFDPLGMVVATAIIGKNGEGDRLDNYTPVGIPNADMRAAIFNHPHTYLQDATSFFYYDLNAWKRDGQPNHVLTLLRETHTSDEKGQDSKTQISFSYSDGFGKAIMTKVRAESGDAFRIDQGQVIHDHASIRWVGNGRTVFNNKGNPVKQYEPYFSHSFNYENETELVEYGVSPVLHYDALGRNIKTDFPDGTLTRVEFTPWEQKSWDQNDTVLESQWYIDQGNPDPQGAEPVVTNNSQNYKPRAAWLAAQHSDTPKIEHLDTLGRVFSMEDDNGPEGVYTTSFVLDILGQQKEVINAKGRIITSNHFNMAQEPIYTESMDAGRRWMASNIMGSPLYQWNDRDIRSRMVQDELQRNIATFIKEGNNPENWVYMQIYGEFLDQPEQTNHYGQLYQLYDQAGRITNLNFDFKGILKTHQEVCKDYKNTIDWSALYDLPTIADMNQIALTILEDETFETSGTFDALNRPIMVSAPDNSQTIYTYNEQANFIEKSKPIFKEEIP